MTTCNRDTLKQFFEEGRRPTGNHFRDLIDSTLNMSDEGFRKTADHGFEITGDEALLSFYREQNNGDDKPIWSVNFGGDRNQLLLRTGDGRGPDEPPPVLSLDLHQPLDNDLAQNPKLPPECRVGIGIAQPQAALDVFGVIASHGRRGLMHQRTPEGKPLLANGQWHALTGPLRGCQALEITAGVGLPDQGRFALVHAIAMNTYNPMPGWLSWLSRLSRRNPIRCQHAWYGQRCDRLELRWAGSSGRHGHYHLEIRTQCDYGADRVIQASVSALWHDPHMSGGATA